MRAAAGVWRWRRNPLRRGTDLTEAWVALVAVVLIAVAGPLVAWLCGSLTESALQDAARDQRRHRHMTTATVVRALHDRPVAANPDGISDAVPRGRAAAVWTGTDGSRHRGALSTFKGDNHAGDRLRIWTDDRGRLVNRPMRPRTVTAHAVLAGFGAGAATAVLIVGGRRVVVWRLVQRRYARLDRAWSEAGPDWGRAGAGS
ncbi:Rv1733c family protein [Streptomyces sp. NBC_00388]|uniref:Rv1733c family protein n=1 Tax=Streptomyces sp. NBC_00388 TaxID=2975735 RepID=UPI002E1B06AB